MRRARAGVPPQRRPASVEAGCPAPAIAPDFAAMLSLAGLTLGQIPRIAAPLTDHDVRREPAEVRRYADLVELRIDQFERHDAAHLAAIAGQAAAGGLPLLATVRWRSEGGGAALDDAQRLAAFDAVLPVVGGVDIELRAAICGAVVERAHRAGKLAIVSYHDFTATPGDAELGALLDAARRANADVVKIAGHAAASADTERLLRFLLAHRQQPMIVIAMGPHGVASRVFFPLLGSLVSYGSVGAASAPGQLPLAELDAELRRYSPEFAAAHA
jgi:3-dehydroquinate dehydratase-1